MQATHRKRDLVSAWSDVIDKNKQSNLIWLSGTKIYNNSYFGQICTGCASHCFFNSSKKNLSLLYRLQLALSPVGIDCRAQK